MWNDLSIYQILIAIGGGFLAGVINTLAGNGSAITLPILMFVLGLPPNVANGTNRIGVLTQGIIGSTTFYRHKMFHPKEHPIIIIPVFLGAMIGMWLAIHVSPAAFKQVFGYLLIIMFFVVLAHPRRWLHPTKKPVSPWVQVLIMIGLGVYGGFIQMGMGIFFLATTVLLSGIHIIRANALKVFVVTTYTLVLLIVFHMKGMVDWRIGSLLAIGQGAGGWITARWASKYPHADVWAYRLLLLTMVWAVVRIFL